MIGRVQPPKASIPIEDPQSAGLFGRYWFLFLDSVVRAVNGLIASQPQQTTQSGLAGLAATLTASDAGLLIEVTDFAHVLRWNGTGWEWGPGEEGGGYFREFAVAPTGSGWHACDGSAGITYLKADGTTGTVTLPNTAGGAAYCKLGAAYAAAITAAAVPTSSTPTFTGTPVTPTGSIGTPSATATVQSGAGATVAHATHIHNFTGNAITPAGTVSTPAITLPGDPVANFQAVLYFRR